MRVERSEGIAALGLSVRLYNVLIRSGLDTVEKVADLINTDPEELLYLRGMGTAIRKELIARLEDAGVDCRALKK